MKPDWTAVAPPEIDKAAVLTELQNGANKSHKHIPHVFLSHNSRSHYHKISFYSIVELRADLHIKSGLWQNCGSNLQPVLWKRNTNVSLYSDTPCHICFNDISHFHFFPQTQKPLLSVTVCSTISFSPLTCSHSHLLDYHHDEQTCFCIDLFICKTVIIIHSFRTCAFHN